jgi:undecaprenyl diphosphate synthase
VIQPSFPQGSGLPSDLHVAIIMDGNGRWATRRGLPRPAGHRAGVAAVRPIVERAADIGVGVLTLFAFSSDNWKRPTDEVDGLMRLLRAYLRFDLDRFVKNGAKLTVIGRRDRLPPRLRKEIARAEEMTAGGTRLNLRIAFDYSSREAIARAASAFAAEEAPSLDRFGQLVAPGAETVDLLIRTGGEKRLSDFLLWESAYAELFFTDKMWPEFTPADLEAAVAEFRGRERRFGKVGEAA